MKMGVPKMNHKTVEVDGAEEKAIGNKHYVFASQRLREDSGIKVHDITYCVEVPKTEVCNRCLLRINCGFSKAERL